MQGGSRQRLAVALVVAAWMAIAVAAAVAAGCTDTESSGAAEREAVRSSDPAATFAPLVSLHPRERWLPIAAHDFVDGSVLRWVNKAPCPDEAVAVGSAVRRAEGVAAGQTGTATPTAPVPPPLDARSLGGGPPNYRHAPARGPRCKPAEIAFRATFYTHPQDAKRADVLGLEEGFALDLADSARKGTAPDTGTVPVYVERRDERVRGQPGVRLTYWLLFGADMPQGPRAATVAFRHEGDWERVDVLLRRGESPDEYVPVSVRYYARGQYADVPWRSVERVASDVGARRDDPDGGGRVVDPDGDGGDHQGRGGGGASHPVVLIARGTHTPYARAGSNPTDVSIGGRSFRLYDRATACPACIRWQTWRDVRDVRVQPWNGFGGSWGDATGIYGAAGPLGPSPFVDQLAGSQG